MDRQKRDKIVMIIGTIVMVLLVAWTFDAGRYKYGLWVVIVLSLLMAAWRLYSQREVYKRVVEMGANHLKLMSQLRAEDKANKLKKNRKGGEKDNDENKNWTHRQM